MNAFIHRFDVVNEPYFEETEASREERKLHSHRKFFNASRQAILLTLGVAAVVVLRITLGF